jgi:imidazole glycerol-phosphate synthase subunit HisH
MPNKITIVDYGIGNILNIKRALEFNGAAVNISSDPKSISRSKRLVLPGVGAYAKAMDSMTQMNLADPVIEAAHKGIPILGICLGMQLLMTRSYEYGQTNGLNLIEGDVIALPRAKENGEAIRVPHTGWEMLERDADSQLIKGINEGDSVYFVHSYMANPINRAEVLAHVKYEEIIIPAIIGKNNVYGCQFHPEKSGEVGLAIIKNFLSI